MTDGTTPSGHGVWVYAVAEEFPVERLSGVTGVAGRPVRAVRAAGLVAVVGSVDLAEFGEEPLRRNLEDLAWLESTARAHHAVVDAVSRAATTLAMRLATVYRDDSRVAALLTDRRDELAAGLRRIAGGTEFGVKAYAAPARDPQPTVSGGTGASQTAAGPGTAYLLRRRAELSNRDQALRAATASAEAIHAALSEQARAARRHVPQHPRLTGETAAMVLNGAYLVNADRSDEFAAAVRALDDQHPSVRLELTGPWPPYSFAAPPDPS